MKGETGTRLASGATALVFLICGMSIASGGRAICLVIAGLLALTAVLLPYATSIRLPGGAGVDLGQKRERDAAAAAADRGVTDPTELIESDDPGPPVRSPEDPTVIGFLNYRVGDLALHAIFGDATSPGKPLEDCELRLYLLDEDEGHLSAVLHPRGRGSGWDVGQGVTGRSYATKQYVVEVGDALWRDISGITSEQKERYKRLRTVAACPVFNAGSDMIGVLTASTAEPSSALLSDPGRQALIQSALLTSRVLVEVLQWFDD